MSVKRLSDLVTVRGRFHRSINLTRDWAGGRDFSEYIVTPGVEAIADTILGELRLPQGTRSWSLTGPYGTGKSAFALFLADVLSSTPPAHKTGRSLRSRFLRGKGAFVPVLMQAERAALVPLLLRAIAGASTPISRPLAKKAEGFAASGRVTGEDVADLLVEAASRATKKGHGGLVVIVDEFGKFLEFAASNPSSSNVLVLQQIAEAAARSKAPILFTTILHSGFADYLAHGDAVRRAEWQKVQGRFRDVPFQLPTEQMLSLTAHALETKLSNGIGDAYEERFRHLSEADVLADALGDKGLQELLRGCLPLHPVVALVLWPLFRSKIAQNERSLFAFLTSHEPHGFQEFLLRTEATSSEASLYGLPKLYDYVTASLGLAALSGTDSRRWSLIDHALHRVPASAPPEVADLVKSIGLLSQYGEPVGLRPSEGLLRLLFDEAEGFDEALELLRTESIVIFRRHSDSFSLWEGSDVDIDQVFEEARARISRTSLHGRLVKALDLRPVVARAHYIQSGTLRYFEPLLCPISPTKIEKQLSRQSQADGRILFLLDAQGTVDEATGRAISRSIEPSRPVLVAVPRVGREVVEALEDFECWQWVRDHSTELEGDPVARQEVRSRFEGASERLAAVAGPVFGARGYALDPSLSSWFYKGRVRSSLSGARGLQELLSSLCGDVFSAAPTLRNELLNRHNLSSAAARARRNLLERMVADQHQPRLGIEGFPPEFSMYASMLKAGGFHTGRGSNWRLRKPTSQDWLPAWKVIDEFLGSAREAPQCLSILISELAAPPFGLRNGPIPVLIAAALLVKGEEVALFEDGVFVPDVTIEVLERLTRRPETFEAQSYRLTKREREVLRELSILSSGPGRKNDALIGVVKSLVSVAAALPPYSKQSRTLADQTCRVRDALLNATDPKRLLFVELPNAVNVKPTDQDSARKLARALKRSTREMTRAYPNLLASIEDSVCAAFSLDRESAREELKERSRPLVRLASDPRLQVFVREAARDDDRDWRVVLGRAVNDGKPTDYWRDEDVTALGIRLQSLSTEFARLEALAAASGDTTTTVVSIGILEDGVAARPSVVSCPRAMSADVEALVGEIDAVLARHPAKDRQAKLVALASLIGSLGAPEEQS